MLQTKPDLISSAPAIGQDEFYVVNVSRGHRDHKYISLWRPENKGYAYPLPWAGRYGRAQIEGHLDYFNGGENISVPCAVLDAIAAAPAAGQIDGDVGPVVANSKANWRLILANLIAKPQNSPKPAWLPVRSSERKLLQPVAGGWSTRQATRVHKDATTTPFQKRLMLALSRAPNQQGSTERLSNALDSTIPAVLVALRSLERRGLIAATPKVEGGQDSSSWRIVAAAVLENSMVPGGATPMSRFHIPAGLDFASDDQGV